MAIVYERNRTEYESLDFKNDKLEFQFKIRIVLTYESSITYSKYICPPDLRGEGKQVLREALKKIREDLLRGHTGV